MSESLVSIFCLFVEYFFCFLYVYCRTSFVKPSTVSVQKLYLECGVYLFEWWSPRTTIIITCWVSNERQTMPLGLWRMSTQRLVFYWATTVGSALWAFLRIFFFSDWNFYKLFPSKKVTEMNLLIYNFHRIVFDGPLRYSSIPRSPTMFRNNFAREDKCDPWELDRCVDTAPAARTHTPDNITQYMPTLAHRKKGTIESIRLSAQTETSEHEHIFVFRQTSIINDGFGLCYIWGWFYALCHAVSVCLCLCVSM